MSEQERETVDVGARVCVTIEKTAKGPRWRVRTKDLADEEMIGRVVAEAVAAYERLEAELGQARRRPFTGQEPAAA